MASCPIYSVALHRVEPPPLNPPHSFYLHRPSELGFYPGQEFSSTFTEREVEEEDVERAEIELAEAAALDEAIGIDNNLNQ